MAESAFNSHPNKSATLGSGWQEHRLGNWKEFVELASQFVDVPAYAFRGQAKAAWPLEPSLARLGRALKYSAEDLS
ncbi:MAG: hypothetical protein U1D55_01380 [Phycisphaerae bacterium]